MINIFVRLLIAALFLIGAVPFSYGNVDDTRQFYGIDGVETSDLSFTEHVQQTVLHTAAQTAVYGGDFGENLLHSAVGHASAVAFDYVGHNLYENPKYKDLTLPPKSITHGLIGGAFAKIEGGDFSSGAIATATSEIVAEYATGSMYADSVIKGDMTLDEAERQIKLISSTVAGAVTLMEFMLGIPGT